MSWSNVNTAQPNWVYIITNMGMLNFPRKYINSFSTGDGINSTKRDSIIGILKQAGGTGPGTCYCNGMY